MGTRRSLAALAAFAAFAGLQYLASAAASEAPRSWLVLIVDPLSLVRVQGNSARESECPAHDQTPRSEAKATSRPGCVRRE